MNKLNLAAVEDYSKAYARKVISQYFADQSIIKGKDLRSFSAITQINLFIIQDLFSTWQQEIAKLESPYFDYQAPEVKEALSQFMNTLSQHIAIRQEPFEPLVKSAVTDTITLYLAPYQFFEDLLKKAIKKNSTISQLKANGKYIQINKPFFNALVNGIEAELAQEFTSEEAIKVLEKIFAEHKETIENPEPYTALFSREVPLFTENFYKEKSKSALETTLPLDLQVDIEQFVLAAKQPPAPVISIPAESAKALNLNDKFSKEQVTLNDRLKQESRSTLLDKHQKSRVESIKNAISLNQKFIFINELFKGDNASFYQALNELEQCADYPAAMHLLRSKYASKYNWDMGSEDVSSFFGVIERKFY